MAAAANEAAARPPVAPAVVEASEATAESQLLDKLVGIDTAVAPVKAAPGVVMKDDEVDDDADDEDELNCCCGGVIIRTGEDCSDR